MLKARHQKVGFMIAHCKYDSYGFIIDVFTKLQTYLLNFMAKPSIFIHSFADYKVRFATKL